MLTELFFLVHLIQIIFSKLLWHCKSDKLNNLCCCFFFSQKHQLLSCSKILVTCTLCKRRGILREDIQKHVCPQTGDCPDVSIQCSFTKMGCTFEVSIQCSFTKVGCTFEVSIQCSFTFEVSIQCSFTKVGCTFEVMLEIITYDEQHNKGHIYRTISHVCHNKIVCPLGKFRIMRLAVVRVHLFWLAVVGVKNKLVSSGNNIRILPPLKRC